MKVYLCGTDLLDLQMGAEDVIIYPTLKSIRKSRKCLDECGIIEYELKKVRVVKQQKLLKRRKKCSL